MIFIKSLEWLQKGQKQRKDNNLSNISVWGWGATTISIWGWGTPHHEYIPIILAAFIESHAYTCVLTRDYVEVLVRETGEIALRLRPDQIPQRGYGEVLSRMREGDLLVRARPDQIPERDYTEVVKRLREGDVVLRVRPDQIPVRERGDIISRVVDEVTARSKGWPWQEDPCLDDEE